MAHWLEERFNAFIGKKNNNDVFDKDAINANYLNHKSEFDNFFICLEDLFCKLQKVRVENIEYKTEHSKYKDSNTMRLIFIAENKTLSPYFRRIIDFTISPEDGFLEVKYSRSKQSGSDNHWKFHQKVDSVIEIESLSKETCFKVIDWLAWKIYSPQLHP